MELTRRLLSALTRGPSSACAELPEDHRDRDLTADLEVARTLVATLTNFVDLHCLSTTAEVNPLAIEGQLSPVVDTAVDKLVTISRVTRARGRAVALEPGASTEPGCEVSHVQQVS
jgi:hypothetical protein